MVSATEEYSLSWKGHIQHVRDLLFSLSQTNNFCDVTLYVERKKIGAHKLLLAAGSGYFKELFEDLKDANPVIVLKGIHFEVLQQILKFIYHGQVSVQSDKLRTFLETANFLRINGLLRNEIGRKRTHSSTSESTSESIYISSTADDQTRMLDNDEDNGKLNIDRKLPEKQFDERSLIAEKSQPSSHSTERSVDHFQNISENSLAQRLLGIKGYGFFKRINSSKQEPEVYSIEEVSTKQVPDSNIDDNESSTPNIELVSDLKSDVKKYTLESPKRTDEWTSDYEYCGHNSEVSTSEPREEVISPQDIIDNCSDTQIDLDYNPSLIKKRKIKSERQSTEVENTKGTESYNEQDSENSHVAEIEWLDDEDEDALQKKMTSFHSTTEDGFQCHICNSIYAMKDSLKKHIAIHAVNTTCRICNLKFSRSTLLQIHMMEVHGFTPK